MDSHWNSVKNDLSGFSGFSLLSLAGPFTNNENSSSVTIFCDLSMLMSIKKLNIVLIFGKIDLIQNLRKIYLNYQEAKVVINLINIIII